MDLVTNQLETRVHELEPVFKQMETSLNQAVPTGKELGCDLIAEILQNRSLIIASNRGPVSFSTDEKGELQSNRGKGGLVTALTGLANLTEAHWIASAQSAEDRQWGNGAVALDGSGKTIDVQFISPEAAAYEGYYNGIANSLLWFLQHGMLDIAHTPTITRTTWQDWKDGYVEVNRLFAESIASQVRQSIRPSLVMLQDYHLYLVAGFLRQMLPARTKYTLMHFIHIPWPGAEDWGSAAIPHAAGDPGRTVRGGFAGVPDPGRRFQFHAHLRILPAARFR